MRFLFISLFVGCCLITHAQTNPVKKFPVRGLCISAPTPQNLDSFIVFMNNELRPRKINTIILRIDYRYQFKSHPELTDTLALSEPEVKKLVEVAKENHIRLIPQINLLGHQSWANKPGKLLSVYKDFDETPWLNMPLQYAWPNSDSLYCKSYCPLHPEIHKILFDVIDEICDAFETNAFHAGMDEVFILGDSKCARCAGKTKAELFAGEVNTIEQHLKGKNRELWIWGDRLLDGRTTGVGMWEGSFNETWPAIDLISKSVVICDWHYDKAEKTAAYFVSKGFRTLTCPWNKPQVAKSQVGDLADFRKHADKKTRQLYLGIVETVWSSLSGFLNGYYSITSETNSTASTENNAWNTFKAIYE